MNQRNLDRLQRVAGTVDLISAFTGRFEAGCIVWCQLSDIRDLKRQAVELKEVVAEQALELRLLKKSMTGDGGNEA